MKLQLLVILVVELLLLLGGVSTSEKPGISSFENGGREEREAYVTLLYGNPVLSVRVLGLSLKLTGTCRDLIVLCVDPISLEDREILEGDGWIVKMLENLSSSTENRPAGHLDKVLAKFSVMELTGYRRVVYLDSDSVVYANIDELFRCGTFCAPISLPGHVSSSIFVVKPDLRVYLNLMSQLSDSTSLLNYFYNSLFSAPEFNAADLRHHNHTEQPMQLPAVVYNADAFPHHTHRDQQLAQQYKVLHHSLGPLKPWKWWAYPLFDQNWHWVELRDNLTPSTDGWYRWWGLLSATAVCLLVFAVVHCLNYTDSSKPAGSVITRRGGVVFDIVVSLLFPLSCFLAFYCIPELMHPHFAISAFSLLTMMFLQLACLCVHNFTANSNSLECPDLTGTLLVSVLLFFSLLVPLYVPCFCARVCVFVTSIFICFIFSYFAIKRSLSVASTTECVSNTECV